MSKLIGVGAEGYSQPHIPRRSKMKEMRLFEVGLKGDTMTTSYEEKINVAANDADEAVKKAREWIVGKTQKWIDEGGLEDMVFNAYLEDKKKPEELTDAEVLATEKYIKKAQKDCNDELRRIQGLRLAKLLDIGTLIV